jgi:Domain of unknown function (DUF6249)
MAEELIPVVLFIVIGAAILGYFYWNHQSRASIMQTVQMALERGAALTPELLTQLGAAVNPRVKDMRRGIIFLALGVAGLLSSLFFTDTEILTGIRAASVFPLMLGIGFLLVWRLNRE